MAEQLEHLRRHGYCTLPSLLSGEALESVQAAFAQQKPAVRQRWSQRADDVAAPLAHADGYFDLPGLLEGSCMAALFTLLSAPRLVALMQAAVGPAAQIVNLQCRTVPPAAETLASCADGFTRFHRDNARAAEPRLGDGMGFRHPRWVDGVKIFVAVSPQAGRGGTAVIGGTHGPTAPPR